MQFYKILFEICKDNDYLLLSQVSLYNIIKVKNKKDISHFNKIASKSIDFIIANKKNCEILVAIELDDSTHNYAKRIDRDLFINKLFNDLSLPLLRFKVNKTYNKNYIESIIKNYIK